ncbi:unnamed protein product [Prorocentrum cordatum]|uniref:peptidylprolyl isomerase n=1 Tax=Prorocentrum cordatum TaxID=2364126 RepID=A0ABN9WDH8_9DINO|nr:unnamed protein product [Polarella glacialis]
MKQMPGCDRPEVRFLYFEGHMHCNRVVEQTTGPTDAVGFMVGGTGMGQDNCDETGGQAAVSRGPPPHWTPPGQSRSPRYAADRVPVEAGASMRQFWEDFAPAAGACFGGVVGGRFLRCGRRGRRGRSPHCGGLRCRGGPAGPRGAPRWPPRVAACAAGAPRAAAAACAAGASGAAGAAGAVGAACAACAAGAAAAAAAGALDAAAAAAATAAARGGDQSSWRDGGHRCPGGSHYAGGAPTVDKRTLCTDHPNHSCAVLDPAASWAPTLRGPAGLRKGLFGDASARVRGGTRVAGAGGGFCVRRLLPASRPWMLAWSAAAPAAAALAAGSDGPAGAPPRGLARSALAAPRARRPTWPPVLAWHCLPSTPRCSLARPTLAAPEATWRRLARRPGAAAGGAEVAVAFEALAGAGGTGNTGGAGLVAGAGSASLGAAAVGGAARSYTWLLGGGERSATRGGLLARQPLMLGTIRFTMRSKCARTEPSVKARIASTVGRTWTLCAGPSDASEPEDLDALRRPALLARPLACRLRMPSGTRAAARCSAAAGLASTAENGAEQSMELLVLEAALSPAAEVLAGTAAALQGALEAASSGAAPERLREASHLLRALEPEHERLRRALAGAAAGPATGTAGRRAPSRTRSLRPGAPRGARAHTDFSAFSRARWEAERLKGAAMLAAAGDAAGDAGGAGVKIWSQEMPRPAHPEKPCSQVRGRHIVSSSSEKIRRIYAELLATGVADRTGFIRGASAARFGMLAQEKSDDGITAKKGGDLGWLSRGKMDSKFDEVAFVTPRGACSPPFKLMNCFHLFFSEDRKA